MLCDPERKLLNLKSVIGTLNKGGKFLQKLQYYVEGRVQQGNSVLSVDLERKLATVKVSKLTFRAIAPRHSL